MTQDELARLTGVSQGFISLMLQGKRVPGYRVAKALAEVTQTRPELWLEGRVEDMREAMAGETKERQSA